MKLTLGWWPQLRVFRRIDSTDFWVRKPVFRQKISCILLYGESDSRLTNKWHRMRVSVVVHLVFSIAGLMPKIPSLAPTTQYDPHPTPHANKSGLESNLILGSLRQPRWKYKIFHDKSPKLPKSESAHIAVSSAAPPLSSDFIPHTQQCTIWYNHCVLAVCFHLWSSPKDFSTPIIPLTFHWIEQFTMMQKVCIILFLFESSYFCCLTFI